MKPEGCRTCTLDYSTKVPPYGSLKPKIAFIGQAPGKDEVAHDPRRPFVGRAGKVLEATLSLVMERLGVTPEELPCYYTNACMCYPSGDRVPTNKEVDCCYPRLLAELSKLDSGYLTVTLGAVPISKIAKLKTRKVVNVRGIYTEADAGLDETLRILPTLHPAFLLRAPERWLDFYNDLEDAVKIALGRTPPVIEPPYQNYRLIDTKRGFESLLDELVSKPVVAVDLETEGDFQEGRILCCGFSWQREQASILDWSVIEKHGGASELSQVLSKVRCSFQNGAYDILWLDVRGVKVRLAFDTMLAHFLLDERPGGHSLERLAIHRYRAPAYKTLFRKKYGLGTFIKDEDAFAEALSKAPRSDLYNMNGADSDYTYRLTLDLAKELKEENLMRVMNTIMLPAVMHFEEFRKDGMLIDQDYVAELAEKWKGQMSELDVQMRQFNGASEINFNSTQQLARYLYDALKLKPFGKPDKRGKIDEEDIVRAIQTVKDPEAREYWRSKRSTMSEGLKGFGGEVKGMKARSTSTYMLYWLKQQHELPGLLIKYKHARKRYSLYASGLGDLMWPDGRVRPKYNLSGIRTGRFKTSSPALHNLPRGDEIYNIFIADPNWVIIHADYSQADMRMMGHLSGDTKLIEMLEAKDIHTEVVKELFHLTDEEVEEMDGQELSDKRIAAKMIDFGLPYGRSSKGLAPQLGISDKEAKEYMKTFFSKMPRLEEWIAEQKEVEHENGEMVSIFGYRRRFYWVRDRYHQREVDRQAVNFLIQNSVNALTILAHMEAVKRLRAVGIPAKVWMHIHDSFNVLVPRENWKQAVSIIAHTMHEVPFETVVPFRCEVQVGRSWGKLVTVYKG